MCELHSHSAVEVLGVSTGLTPDEFQFAVLVTLAVAFAAVMFVLEMRRIRGGDD